MHYIYLTHNLSSHSKKVIYLLTMRNKFEDFQTLLHQFHTDIGCNNIIFNYAKTAQQEDGCSCGIFVLAGILVHIYIYNRQPNPFYSNDVSCLRRELFHSVLLSRLSIEQSLKALGTHKRPQTPMLLESRTKQRQNNNDSTLLAPSSSLLTTTLRKRSWEQSLITF